MDNRLSQDNSRLLEELLGYSDWIFRICLGFVKTPWEAEELIQDVYLCALKKLNTLRNKDRLKQWLLRITRNTCLNRVRKERLYRLLLFKVRNDQVEMNTPELNILQEEQHQKLKNAVNRLPQKQRIVFIFREYGQLSYREIASILGIKEGTVMSRLNRARQAVITQLKEG